MSFSPVHVKSSTPGLPSCSKTGSVLALNLAAECFKRHSKSPWWVLGGLGGRAPLSEGMTMDGMEAAPRWKMPVTFVGAG